MKTPKYSIAQTFMGSLVYYSFSKGRIQYGVYEGYRTDDHFTNDEAEAREAFDALYNEEQSKDWGGAKPVRLYCDDKLIKYQ